MTEGNFMDELELVIDNTNVVYIDEYPELKKRVFLRRLAAERSGDLAVSAAIIQMPEQRTPDDAA